MSFLFITITLTDAKIDKKKDAEADLQRRRLIFPVNYGEINERKECNTHLAVLKQTMIIKEEAVERSAKAIDILWRHFNFQDINAVEDALSSGSSDDDDGGKDDAADTNTDHCGGGGEVLLEDVQQQPLQQQIEQPLDHSNLKDKESGNSSFSLLCFAHPISFHVLFCCMKIFFI